MFHHMVHNSYQKFLEALLNPFASDEAAGLALVSLSYIVFLTLFGLMIYIGFKTKSYGMPFLGIVAHLAVITICAFIGPFSDHSHLFCEEISTGKSSGLCPETTSGQILIWFWRLLFALQGTIFIQYLMYGKKIIHPIKMLHERFYFIAAIGLVLNLLFFWFFIVFYQDFYVNEASAFAVLIIAVFYLYLLSTRTDLTGLSPAVAWLWTAGMGLLYLGTAVGNMKNPYPDHANTGYGLIYLIYVVTVVFLAWYAVALTKRRRQLAPEAAATEGMAAEGLGAGQAGGSG